MIDELPIMQSARKYNRGRRLRQANLGPVTEAAALVWECQANQTRSFLARIRLLIPSSRETHDEAIEGAFDAGDLTAPRLAVSEIELARAISEFTGIAPNEASIETLERRFNSRLRAGPAFAVWRLAPSL